MEYVKKAWSLLDTYLIARILNKPSTANFWYLKEPANLKSQQDLNHYQQTTPSPFYPIDYRYKLSYPLKNREGIIVLPYREPIGIQINPEAAFQYALGLHDIYLETQNRKHHDTFLHYANFFLTDQNNQGLWPYQFDWFGSKAPWYSALAQSRGASVMLRAFLLTGENKYRNASYSALQLFATPVQAGGFLQPFSKGNCHYYEEYPNTPTGVLNGFMAALISLWEMQYWLKDAWLNELWQNGIQALEQMLPCYQTGWWSIYDLDPHSPITNVNSPRYHLLEIDYLRILTLLSQSPIIADECHKRVHQCRNPVYYSAALLLKAVRKITYR